MANKSNIRSMRFSDDIAALIESQPGSTFTQKFENLVTRCYFELPQRKEELKAIEKQINQERNNLWIIREKKTKVIQQIDRLTWGLNNLKVQVERATKALEEIE